jgi:hypothetical protein
VENYLMLKGNKIYARDGVPKVYINDPDALRYIAAVQAADQQSLEPAVRKAITDFVVGCKADGIWSAIKASCILMGARTLSGALVPLVGAAPTNNGPFVSGDYNRKTGLIGNGSTKYIDTNRASSADPQNSVHISVYVATAATNTTRTLIGDTATAVGLTIMTGGAGGTLFARTRSDNVGTPFSNISGEGNTTGFKGARRSSSTAVQARSGGTTTSGTQTSGAPTSENYGVFARTPSSPALYGSDRIAFYSIGESLDLALLDTRVTALYNAIGAAI